VRERIDQPSTPARRTPCEWAPYIDQVNRPIKRLDQPPAVVVSPVNELTPYLTQVNVLLERLTVKSIRRAQQPVPVVTSRPPPMAVPTPVYVPINPPLAVQPMVVPTPVTPSKQRTIPTYFVKKGALDRPREVEQTPPGEFHWPEEHDFPTTDTPQRVCDARGTEP